MMTVLTIILAVLIAANVWLACYTAKREKQRRAKLQERMDEFDNSLGEVCNELAKAKQRLREAMSANAALKRSFEETVKEYEALKQQPVDAGQPAVHDKPGDPANKPNKPLKPKKAAKKTKK